MENGLVLPAITTAQMAEVDRLMIEEYSIQLIQMMENAGRHLAEQARRMLGGDLSNRRVVVLANWPEYGGAVLDEKAKDRPAYADEVGEVRLYPDRAVLPLDLLQAVGHRRKARSHQPVDSGVNRRARAYPLSGLTYCAHCEALAERQSDPRLRTRLTGTTNQEGFRRYKHKTGILCGCHNRTAPADQVEADFEKLIKLLTIREEAVTYMTELAVQAEREKAAPEETRDLEREKADAITLCQRRIDAAVHLYGEGRISREEYLRRVEQNEREITHWQNRTSDTERIALELTSCIEAVNQMHRVWATASDDEKKGMAQHLFSELVYNVDTRRFERFSLKPWADRFLLIRMDLYYQMFGDLEGENENSTDLLGQWNPVPHRGLYAPSFPRVPFAIAFAAAIAYYGRPQPTFPLPENPLEKGARNREIKQQHARGDAVPRLAVLFGVSQQRIHQILQGRRR